MTKEILIVILTSSVIASFVSSIITGILAPFVNWGIEKRKIKLENRKKLIPQTRTALLQDDFSGPMFIKSQAYNRIRPYISKELDNRIRSTTINLVVGNVGGLDYNNLLRGFVSKELNKIEKKWGLI